MCAENVSGAMSAATAEADTQFTSVARVSFVYCFIPMAKPKEEKDTNSRLFSVHVELGLLFLFLFLLPTPHLAQSNTHTLILLFLLFVSFLSLFAALPGVHNPLSHSFVAGRQPFPRI